MQFRYNFLWWRDAILILKFEEKKFSRSDVLNDTIVRLTQSNSKKITSNMQNKNLVQTS